MESLDINADNLMAFREDVIGRDPNSSDNAHTKIIKPPPRINPINTKIHVLDHLYFLVDIAKYYDYTLGSHISQCI